MILTVGAIFECVSFIAIMATVDCVIGGISIVTVSCDGLLKHFSNVEVEEKQCCLDKWYSKDFEAQSLLHLFEHAKSSPCGSIKNPKLPTAYKRH